MRRWLALGVAVLAIAGILVWRYRGADTPPSAPAPEAPVATAPIAGDTPRWVGQSGVRGRRIAGSVVDETGAAIANARVRLTSIAARAGLSDEATVTTDARGRFDFGGRSGSDYTLIAEAPRLTSALQRVDMRDPLVVPDQLRLVLHACSTSIHGTIRDNAGGVIGGARVARDRSSTGGAVSNADGTYELCIPAGGVQLVLSADGYATAAEHVSVFGPTRRDFELSPGTTITGRVVRAADKTAVADALVEIRPDDRTRGDFMLIASSDDEGRFVVDGVAPGRHAITARADRLATATPVSAIAEIGGASEEVVCELVGTASVSGKVVVGTTDTPVAGVSVYLMGPASRPSATTQTDGTFTIDHVLPGEYRPMVRELMGRRGERGPPPAKVRVESADVTGVVISVPATGSISGRVLHDGKPVDGARVRIDETNISTESNADGTYTLRWVDAGTVTLYAESQRVGAFARSTPITMGEAEDRTNVDIELDLSASIAGIVVDTAGTPVPGVFVSFSLVGARDFGMATTADDGTFIARALSGGGDYVYEVRQSDRSPLRFAPAEGKRFPPISVPYGQSHITGVRIVIRVERLAIAGRVTDEANKPVADVLVRAYLEEGGRIMFGAAIDTRSDQNGAFVLRDLMPGTYQLQASSGRSDGRAERVAAGQSNVAIRLAALGGIDGTLEGFSAVAILVIREDRQEPPRRAVATNATFSLRNLPAGVYEVIARKATGVEHVRVTVAPGEIAKVTLRATQFGVVEGVVVDAKTRAPIPDLHCISGLDGPWGTASKPATSDARGAFRLEAPAGPNIVACGGGMTNAVVTAGQTTRVEIVVTNEEPRQQRIGGEAGWRVENQLGDVVVGSVRPNGPAARAGVMRGDVVVAVDGTTVPRNGEYVVRQAVMGHSLDTPLEVTLERGDKQLVVRIQLDPMTGDERLTNGASN